MTGDRGGENEGDGTGDLTGDLTGDDLGGDLARGRFVDLENGYRSGNLKIELAGNMQVAPHTGDVFNDRVKSGDLLG